MKPVRERTAAPLRPLMESKYIAANEADEILQDWESQSRRVCFAVCIGELAWHAHWVGIIKSTGSGRWVLVTGPTTNMLSTSQYKEIIVTEDAELLGLRFRHPDGGAPGFEVNLFIDKYDRLHDDVLPMITKIVQ